MTSHDVILLLNFITIFKSNDDKVINVWFISRCQLSSWIAGSLAAVLKVFLPTVLVLSRAPCKFSHTFL